MLKHGDTFAVFDPYGDAQASGRGTAGIYHAGTRYVSRVRLEVGGRRPLLLGSTITADNTLLAVDMTNAEFTVRGVTVPAETLHILRRKFLWRDRCYERLWIVNFGSYPVTFPVTLEIEADFIDIFEARGAIRGRRGRRERPRAKGGELVFTYHGLDERTRRTRVGWAPEGDVLGESTVRIELELAPNEERLVSIDIRCDLQGERALGEPFDRALAVAQDEMRARRGRSCHLWSSNALFNKWLERSAADVAMMITEKSSGPYPYAGVPWYNTVFGRDGIVTAIEMLWLDPSIARGVLGFLAEHQATETSDRRDAEPGKIVHEMRGGEMAALGEIPFGRYYGTIDATPLFVVLAGAYYRRTADRETIDRLWPNIAAALTWMDRYGDRDADGYLEYASHCPDGLVQQGWRDAADSVFHEDGSAADPPIALAEVQGYAYRARIAAAELATVRGESDLAEELRRRAEELRLAFERDFWSEDLASYAMALDGRKHPCRIRCSSAGHCLWSGIAAPERARRVSETLLSEAMFSGWGVRTIGARQARYNPMSYHNGSIWPHDNAIVAAGLARYGLKDEALAILDGMFGASLYVNLHRMPELFCGFSRREGQGPTLYPVACAPQAWAAAAVFMLLESCLGVSIDAPARQIRFDRPVLPPYIDWLDVRGLAVQDAHVDVRLRRAGRGLAVELLEKEGDAAIVITT